MRYGEGIFSIESLVAVTLFAWIAGSALWTLVETKTEEPPQKGVIIRQDHLSSIPSPTSSFQANIDSVRLNSGEIVQIGHTSRNIGDEVCVRLRRGEDTGFTTALLLPLSECE